MQTHIFTITGSNVSNKRYFSVGCDTNHIFYKSNTLEPKRYEGKDWTENENHFNITRLYDPYIVIWNCRTERYNQESKLEACVSSN